MSLAQRSSLSILISVVRALTYREFKSRFGGYHLGYVWVLAEPMIHVIVLSVIFGFRSREIMPGVEFPMFILTGIIPYDLFVKTFSTCVNAVQANRGLFVYRQVKPIDAFLTRGISELIVHWLAYLVLLGIAWWLGYDVSIHNPLAVVALLVLPCLLGLGLGIIGGTLAGMVPDATKVMPWLTRPLYFISGVIFPISMIPVEYLPYLSWNPLLHVSELARAAFFGPAYVVTVGSWSMILLWVLVLWFVGLLLYRRYRFALVMS